jgi:hypothetical protein
MKKISIGFCLFFLILSCNNISKNKKDAPIDSNKINLSNNINHRWLGTWKYTKPFSGASCEITNAGVDSIEFSLTASSGGNSGELSGNAKVKGNFAKYINTEYNDTCELDFELKTDSIIVNQKKGICGAGMGVTYDGIYYDSTLSSAKSDTSITLASLEILKDKKEEEIFKKLVGKDYDLFLGSSQLSSEDSDLDNFGARVHSSGVRGLFTLQENIIIINDKSKIWAAVINDSCVDYYTNDDAYIKKLPKTIENWRTNFLEKKIIYKSRGQ